ncbi:Pfs, NACHT and ankyrin domain protein [Aspergillus eucalypticola CBS 122712]|uniref:Pfs, NACHT and ankyrin domain protein n=1 Tax=Aspergillus eucalypticola (strain CBS 122712 / IBT 29274) TaxID=1448314 RepID=A0A317VRZ2_ASPEC|nr:Pfs, NACHT and ankyrin domain protein [Aspergillus eucalypticola CBS 122712]PWY75658.1 Pfs, NACHT and ankyrin domain protein [Aspergillus eucalypticola CBS 122712]
MSSPRLSPYANEEYTVGWICALLVELAAARGMLDREDHGEPQTSPATADQNRYTLGTIGHFRVVIACLPKNQLGSSSATASVKDMLFTFPNVRIGLCVGIGAGIPDYESRDEQDVRLGDVVISSDSKTGGVVAYALGKKLADGSFETRSALTLPPRSLGTALGAMQAQHMMAENKIEFYIEQMLEKHPFMRKKGYSRPDQSLDRLFKLEYIHAAGKNCSKCDDSETVEREDRFDDAPVIHYGTIASGDIVVKNAALRDEIRDKHGAICLEMEAAGLMNNFPCVVIRGISDYADSHKNDRWQPYAAAVAAACAKGYLEHIQVKDVCGEPPAKAILERVQEGE